MAVAIVWSNIRAAFTTLFRARTTASHAIFWSCLIAFGRSFDSAICSAMRRIAGLRSSASVNSCCVRSPGLI